MGAARSVNRAISIRQPWVELILRGEKCLEFRSKPTRIRGPIYLYASAKPADAMSAWRQVEKEPGDLPVGRILGTVEIVGCHWNERRGCYAYHLGNPRRLRRPRVPCNQPQPVFWRPEFKQN